MDVTLNGYKKTIRGGPYASQFKYDNIVRFWEDMQDHSSDLLGLSTFCCPRRIFQGSLKVFNNIYFFVLLL